MTTTRAESRPETSTEYAHDLLVHDSVEELAAVAVPFLRAGLEVGETALIATRPSSAAVLQDALGGADGLAVLDRQVLYGQRTPAALTALRTFVDQRAAGTPGVRIVAETEFGETPRDWQEWVRFEAVVNQALRHLPLWGLCTYDSTRVPEEAVAAGLRTHPHLVTVAGRRSNPHYEQPADFLRSLPALAEPLEDTEPLLAADDVTDLAGLRHAVAQRLNALGGSPDRTEDLHLAIDEMAANAARHGRPPVRVRLWGSADRVVCTISDNGAGMDAPFAGYGPAHGQDLSRGGMGLWLARQLCDHVDVIDDGTGLTVRLVTSLR